MEQVLKVQMETQGTIGGQGTTGGPGGAGVQGATGAGTQGAIGGQGTDGAHRYSTGTDGTQGTDGGFGGASFDYTFDGSSASPGDPGTGKVRLNSLVRLCSRDKKVLLQCT